MLGTSVEVSLMYPLTPLDLTAILGSEMHVHLFAGEAPEAQAGKVDQVTA